MDLICLPHIKWRVKCVCVYLYYIYIINIQYTYVSIYIHINCTVRKTTVLYFCVSMNQEAAILQHGGWTPFRSPASSHRPTSPLLRMLFDGSVILKFVVTSTIWGTFGDDTQNNSSGHAQSQLVIYLEVPFLGDEPYRFAVFGCM